MLKKKNGQIYFLYHAETGKQSKSFGIEVAKLAGLPYEVITLALKKRQKVSDRQNESKNFIQTPITQENVTLSISEKKETSYNEEAIKQDKLIKFLKKINLEDTTPLQAFKILEKVLSII